MTISEKIILYEKRISKISKVIGAPEKDLLIKFLIDSHQFSEKSLRNEKSMEARINTLAKEIENNRKQLNEKYYHPPVKFLQKEKCNITRLDWRRAKEILINYHHIGSYRKGGVHLGLNYEVESGINKLMGIVSFSKYDFSFKPYSIFSIFDKNEVFNLSRLYLFDWAPHNAVSFFISKSNDYLRKHYPKIKCLITCINPNTAHQGKTFNACNWTEIAQFTGAPYLYLDKKTVTIRHLFETFGTLELPKLKRKLGRRLIISKSEVLPQKMYMYILNKKTRNNFFLDRLDKIYSFDDYNFSPEYGLTGNDKESAITHKEAERRIKNIGTNVIAGYLESSNSDMYSSIIVKNRGLKLNIRRKIKDISKSYINHEELQLRAVCLSKFYKTFIIYGDEVEANSVKSCLKSDKFNTVIILSCLKEDTNQLFSSIIKIAKPTRVNSVILYDYFHGFNFIRM